MAKNVLTIKQGILSKPTGTTDVITISTTGVIRIPKANLTNVKRPKQYK